MVEEVAPGIYWLPIPLPGSLLGSVNSYVLKGRERSVIIDPGMNLDLCMKAMDEGLRYIGVDAGKSDFFITHTHPDHFPLVSRLLGEGSVIYLDEREAEVLDRLKSGVVFANLKEFAARSGFPDTDLQEILPRDITDHSAVEREWPFRFVREGDELNAGDYRFRCISTPGHSPGHTCLYEPTNRLFLAGDHLLSGITPGVQTRISPEDPLAAYLAALDRIYSLDVRLVLPGHREPFANFRERIDELKEHHRVRSAEIAAEMKDGAKSVYEIASRVTWSVVDADSWDAAPNFQKLLATGETLAHLRYLENKGVVRHEMRDDILMFSLA